MNKRSDLPRRPRIGLFAIPALLILAFSMLSCDLLFPPSFRVTYFANGASSGDAPVDSRTYKAGTSVTVLSEGSLARSHASFSGWNTQAAGDGTALSAGGTFVMGSSDVNLYAIWAGETSYSITYDANGATGGSAPTDSTRYYQGESATILGNTGSLLKTGSDFWGWNTLSDGTGTTYQADSTLTIGTSGRTLYAKWGNPPVAALGGGAAVDISALNSKANRYVILSVMPGASAQGNDGENYPPSSVGYTIASSAMSASHQPAYQADSTTNPLPILSAIYGEAQTRRDLKMRVLEDEMLKREVRQLAPSSPRSLKSVPSGISVGTVWNGVNILDGADVWRTIDTTCRYISTHAYFFIDNRDILAMETHLTGYGTAFDSIYEVNRAKFGTENDTDRNGKVTIVFSGELGSSLLGYFYSIDKHSVNDNARSNEGDIFYITADASRQGDSLKGTLAHEFQHMIYYDEHYDLGVSGTYSWLNEALSQAAEYYNGYTSKHLAWIQRFLASDWPNVSLTYWTSSNYGYGAVFIRYLIAQYGDTAIKNMCSTNRIGIDAVETATGSSFNVIFGNFLRALAMSGTGDSADPKYGFGSLDLRSVQTSGRKGLLPYTSPVLSAGSSSPYAAYPYQLDFFATSGSFSTMTLTGTNFAGSALGLTH